MVSYLFQNIFLIMVLKNIQTKNFENLIFNVTNLFYVHYCKTWRLSDLLLYQISSIYMNQFLRKIALIDRNANHLIVVVFYWIREPIIFNVWSYKILLRNLVCLIEEILGSHLISKSFWAFRPVELNHSIYFLFELL